MLEFNVLFYYLLKLHKVLSEYYIKDNYYSHKIQELSEQSKKKQSKRGNKDDHNDTEDAIGVNKKLKMRMKKKY